MNGGINVSKDGSLWIATRISSDMDGGIYRSTDGLLFLQILSVSTISFKCCDISEDNKVILICTMGVRNTFICVKGQRNNMERNKFK